MHVRRNCDSGDVEGVEDAMVNEIDFLLKNKRQKEKKKKLPKHTSQGLFKTGFKIIYSEGVSIRSCYLAV